MTPQIFAANSCNLQVFAFILHEIFEAITLEIVMIQIAEPENELPGTWSVAFTFIHDKNAVGIFGGFIYSTGFTFRIAVRVNNGDIAGIKLFDGLTRWVSDRPPVEGDAGMQLSLRYRAPDGKESVPGFRNVTGSGGDSVVSLDFWVSPMPAVDDEVSIALTWPKLWDEPLAVSFAASDMTSQNKPIILWPQSELS